MSDPKMQASTNPITELKATAHLMTMEDGLFCVFNTPGAVPPDAATGLPGVRITAAPGQGGFPGTVGISGFNAEGWLGGDAGAAVVRPRPRNSARSVSNCAGTAGVAGSTGPSAAET